MDVWTFRGVTLFDTIITLSIVVTIAAMVVPQMASAERSRLISAAAVLRSDIELAQTMTIASPSEPVVVRFDPPNRQYWLAFAATPDTPITRPGLSEPYLVQLGRRDATAAGNVGLTITGLADNTLRFNSLGGLSAVPDSPSIALTLNNLGIDLVVSHLTGSISESEIVPHSAGDEGGDGP